MNMSTKELLIVILSVSFIVGSVTAATISVTYTDLVEELERKALLEDEIGNRMGRLERRLAKLEQGDFEEELKDLRQEVEKEFEDLRESRVEIPSRSSKNKELNIISVERGIASWYGDYFHGRTTANGEVYDMYALTAAHKTLPFNTKVRVVCIETDKSVTVRINDRGPFVRGRIIDLSRKAAEKIGLINRGIGEVKLEIIA